MAAHGIRVRPGFIYTEMHTEDGEPVRVNRVAAMADVIPMGRGGEAEEIAEAIVWLASETASCLLYYRHLYRRRRRLLSVGPRPLRRGKSFRRYHRRFY